MGQRRAKAARSSAAANGQGALAADGAWRSAPRYVIRVRPRISTGELFRCSAFVVGVVVVIWTVIDCLGVISEVVQRQTPQSVLARREREAESQPTSYKAAIDCAETAVLQGRIERALYWNMEALRRKIEKYYGQTGAAAADFVMPASVLHLFCMVERTAVYLLRYLRQVGIPRSVMQEVRYACGDPPELKRLEDMGDWYRSDAVRLVSRCASEQGAIAASISWGGRADHVNTYDMTQTHILAYIGDPELLHAAHAAFGPGEARRQAEARDRFGRTPHAIAVARGFSEVADILSFAAPEAVERLPDKVVCATYGPGCSEPSAQPGPGEQEDFGGGWRGSGEGVLGSLREDWCEVDVLHEPLSADQFRDLALVPERPVIVRGGRLANTTARVRRLRELLDRRRLLQHHGKVQGHVCTRLPEAGGKPSGKQTLKLFAMEVAHGYYSVSEEQLYWKGRGAELGLAEADVVPGWLPGPTAGRQNTFNEPSTVLIGPPGSGAAPHFHDALVHTLAYGLKRWYLLPPRDAHYSSSTPGEWATVGAARFRESGHRVLECLQHPGDTVWVPDHWGHATLNLEHSVSASTHLDGWRDRIANELAGYAAK
eukprot:TRINITY_DN60782_c0_g1_i1.p1 TRINITY_DN60782_c0_g1~~TRINITY_DN60782_c0_g1_i1.p1  ORF type:complete len:622 (+),score=151.07 TRINITY_DN60782_c0_g1_i1:69-1868(+)